MTRFLGAIHSVRPNIVPPLTKVVNLSAPKSMTNWFDGIDFGAGSDPMLGNDKIGCCVPVSAYQIERTRAQHVWGPSSFIPTTDQVLKIYSLFGYNPNDPTTDRGIDTVKFMTWWASKGLPLDNPADGTNAINLDVIAWAQASLQETPAAIDIAGPARITLALPAALEGSPVSAWGDAPGTGDGWAPGTWGQHSVAAGGQKNGSLLIETWGETVWAHPLFLARYWLATDIAASRLWFDTTGTAPSGVDWITLLDAVSQLTP